jgi:hypothetical protein
MVEHHKTQEDLNVCHTNHVMEERGWGDRNRIRPHRRLDRCCRDQRISVGRNQPDFDLQQRRLEALAIGSTLGNTRRAGLTERLNDQPRAAGFRVDDALKTGYRFFNLTDPGREGAGCGR